MITFFFNILYDIYTNEIISKQNFNVELKSQYNIVLMSSIAICWRNKKLPTIDSDSSV